MTVAADIEHSKVGVTAVYNIYIVCPPVQETANSLKLVEYFLIQVNKKGTTYIKTTLVLSKSMEPSETISDFRTSTYQMCQIEENTNRTTKFHK